MPRVLVLMLSLAVVSVAACGGDGDDDEGEIRDVIRSSLTTNDAEGDCREWLSDSLIRRTYRTRERCVRVQRDDDNEPARAVEFTSVEVEEDAATAQLEVQGGDSDGAQGALELVREDGVWRIDDISIPLLRSLVEAGVRSGERSEDLPPGALDCVGRELAALPDTELREVTYAAVGETPVGQRRILEFFADCEGAGGRSILRQIFEQGVAESLRESGTGGRAIRCIVRELRARVSDEDLVGVLTQSQAEIERLGAAAAAACGQAQPGPA